MKVSPGSTATCRAVCSGEEKLEAGPGSVGNLWAGVNTAEAAAPSQNKQQAFRILPFSCC